MPSYFGANVSSWSAAGTQPVTSHATRREALTGHGSACDVDTTSSRRRFSALGLPRPDHRILESHPIINDQLIHHLRHGDIAVKGDIAQLDGEDVVFKDGSRLAVDLILFATGYKYSIPYVDHSVFSWTGTKPDLSFGLFNANDDRIFPIGFTETNAGGYHTLDDAAVLVANCVLEQTTRSSHWHQTWAILCADPDLSGGIRFVDSERHKNYVDNERRARLTCATAHAVVSAPLVSARTAVTAGKAHLTGR